MRKKNKIKHLSEKINSKISKYTIQEKIKNK